MGRGVYRNYYKGHVDTIKGGGGRREREGGSAGMGWREGKKMHTTVIE